MKILFGVQGTGNGHISRARAIGKALSENSFDVDYIFSGRDPNQYNDMELFGNYQTKKGLTLFAEQGKINYLKTSFGNDLWGFYRDIRQLQVKQYDLILSDFEPISAWAGKLNKVPVIAIGHQNAFEYSVPKEKNHPLFRLIVSIFGWGCHKLPMHWYHYKKKIIPPIVPQRNVDLDCYNPRSVLVYAPWEKQEKLIHHFSLFKDFEFHVFTPEAESLQNNFDNVFVHAISRTKFLNFMNNSKYVICNAGFETLSECIHLGKKILSKPIKGHSEQLSNAKALKGLGLGMRTTKINEESIQKFFDYAEDHQGRIIYPDTAAHIVHWIKQANWGDIDTLASKLWSETQFINVDFDIEGYEPSVKPLKKIHLNNEL